MAVEQAKEKAKSAIKEGAKKLIKRFGWGWLLSWILPFIPANLFLVKRTLGENLTSPEGILMLPIAAFADTTIIILYVIEIWFDLGIFSTLLKWLINGFFATWIYIRGSSSTGDAESKENKKEDETEENSPDTLKMPAKESPKTGSQPAPPKPQKKAA